MIKLCDFPYQKTEGRIPELPLIILGTAQLLGQYPLQLLIVSLRQLHIVCQLVNGQGIAVFSDIPVHLVPVVLEIIGRIQLLPLLPVNDRVRKVRHNRLLPVFPIQELHQLPQRGAYLFQTQDILRFPEYVALDFPEQRKLLLHLRDGRFSFQKPRDITKPLPGLLKRRHLLHRGQHQAIHEIVEALRQLILIGIVHQRRNVLQKLRLVSLA